eukprot:473540_1
MATAKIDRPLWNDSTGEIKDKCLGDISSCKALDRIGHLLNQYQEHATNICESQRQSYSYIQIYNDFHHVLLEHAPVLENVMEFVQNKYNIVCNDLGACLPIRRNFRRRDKVLNESDPQHEATIGLHSHPHNAHISAQISIDETRGTAIAL